MVHFFCCGLKVSFLDKFGPKKSKLSVEATVWYLYRFEYAEFNGDVHFFRFRPETLF